MSLLHVRLYSSYKILSTGFEVQQLNKFRNISTQVLSAIRNNKKRDEPVPRKLQGTCKVAVFVNRIDHLNFKCKLPLTTTKHPLFLRLFNKNVLQLRRVLASIQRRKATALSYSWLQCGTSARCHTSPQCKPLNIERPPFNAASIVVTVDVWTLFVIWMRGSLIVLKMIKKSLSQPLQHLLQCIVKRDLSLANPTTVNSTQCFKIFDAFLEKRCFFFYVPELTSCCQKATN